MSTLDERLPSSSGESCGVFQHVLKLEVKCLEMVVVDDLHLDVMRDTRLCVCGKREGATVDIDI